MNKGVINFSKTKTVQRESVMQDFAQLGSMILRDLNDTQSQSFLRRYTSADVERFIQDPQRYAKELGVMSENLYQSSPHYRKLVSYYANMPTLDYIIEPFGLDLSKTVNEKGFRTSYQRALDLADLMSLKHEVKKALKVAWVRDTYYGYQHQTKDSFFLQRLPNDYCQISSIEDGVYNFAFNFEYFDRNPAQLDFYPPEFASLYRKFQSGSEGAWIELDSSKTFLIKINEEQTYDVPPFAGIFKSIFDIEDYKALKKASETINNYKFVVQKIPIRDKSERNNDFLIDLTNVAMFHNKTITTLPESIGLITTPFEVETINFAKDKSETDNVQEAEREFYSSAGTSSQLFNNENSSTQAMTKSMIVDEQEVFTLLRQVERAVNRKMRNEVKGTFKFRIKFLDITENNRKNVVEQYLQSAQYGLPVKMLLSASLGLSPSSTINLAYLENEVLDLTSKFIPLSSSHTQSGADPTDEGGRPESNDDELTEKGEETRESGANDNKE